MTSKAGQLIKADSSRVVVTVSTAHDGRNVPVSVTASELAAITAQLVARGYISERG